MFSKEISEDNNFRITNVENFFVGDRGIIWKKGRFLRTNNTCELLNYLKYVQDGLPEDDVSYFSNGSDLHNNGDKAGSDSEDEPPPLPPPRSFIEKPLPVLPNDSPSDSEIEDDSGSGYSDLDNEETRLIEDPSSEEAVTPDDGDLKSNKPILAG